MKRLTSFLFLLLCVSALTKAQTPVEGLNYYLPKTSLEFTLEIEETKFIPGELAIYSDRYLRKPVRSQAEKTYRIVETHMDVIGEADTTKQYTVFVDRKHTIISLQRDNNGMLTHINHEIPPRLKELKPQRLLAKTIKLNPRDYFTEEMLAAGSHAKLAELVAKEIYNIRESRNQLERGEAEFMPKDGEQLKIMLNRLDTQEKALRQLFDGEEISNTFEVKVKYTPQPEKAEDIVFRFSSRLGLTDADDLAGEPYYINIEDLKQVKPLPENMPADKKAKDDIGLIVQLPGKIKVTLGNVKEKLMEQELYAAQYGRLENLSANLFTKKMLTRVRLSPVTGCVEALDIQPIE